MRHIIKLVIILSLLFVASCATNKLQIDDKEVVSSTSDNNDLSHSFFLVGDAGYNSANNSNQVLSLLKNKLQNASKNTTILFLGDNIYPNGMPKKSDSGRDAAENSINAQLESVKDFSGKTIFIPGNHDWYSNGLKGLERQQKYIENVLGKKSFYPKNGCPIEKININDEVVLIIVDSQWYLENWDNSPTINDNCEIKTRAMFFDELEGLIKKNRNKTTLIALHHPMFSNGPHGGQYSARQHLYPFENNIPLPGIGSLVNLIRQTGGVYQQDNQNKNYQSLRKRLITIAQESTKIIFVSGHEHSLQYINQDNIPQIISGSGSKVSATKNIGKGVFSYGGLGYVRLDIFKDNSSRVHFFTIEEGSDREIFNTQILAPTNKYYKNYPEDSLKTYSSSVYTQEEIDKSGMYRFLWGDRYRKYYGLKINALSVNLDTLFGGLIPTRKGGGHQSQSLHLEDRNGKEYVMRALRKNALKYLQAVAFKDLYIEGQFDNTTAENQLLDVFTGAHPYVPFTVGILSDAIEVYHTNPKLYYIPKQNALKNYNDDFGNELYMIEERASSGHGNQASFGYSNKLISTDDLFKKLRKSDKYFVDESSYIRARLFDMLIGDWDRHEDQWRWASFKQNDGRIMYRPVPRDRDQAFSIMGDGVLLGFMTKAIPPLRLMQSYKEELRSVKWFNLEPYPLDVALIHNSNQSEWDKQAVYIQNNLSDQVIEDAFTNIPKEVNDETITDIKRKLKGRRSNLKAISENYFKYINRFVVVRGTDKDDYFTIMALPKGQASIKIHRIEGGKKGALIHDRVYDKNVSKEIWLYGLDDKDTFEVIGQQEIKLIIVGGQNNDTYIVKNGTRVHIYDYKSKKNDFKDADKAKLHKTDKYYLNVYNYKKFNYSLNQLIPSISFNPDDGLGIGLTNTWTHYGFNRNPFSSQHQLHSEYYSSTNGFNIGYKGEFANLIGNANLLVEGYFTNPNYAENFFGYGNETIYDKNNNLDYYRVRQSKYGGSLGFVYRGKQGSKMHIKGVYESIKLENTEDRILTSEEYEDLAFLFNQNIFKRKDFVGLEANYLFENYNNKIVPTLAMRFEFDSGFKVNTKESDRSIFYIKPSIGFIHNLSQNHRWVLATKLAGHINFGNQEDLEIYQMAKIGGKNGVRGFNNQRFSGKHSFYTNSDIRFNFMNIKSGFTPMNIGIFGSYDFGRVWLEDDPSNIWHNSVGGGVWIKAAELISGQLGVYGSDENIRVAFKIGFEI